MATYTKIDSGEVVSHKRAVAYGGAARQPVEVERVVGCNLDQVAADFNTVADGRYKVGGSTSWEADTEEA